VTSYCEYVRGHTEDEYNRLYHDREYGFPLKDDNLLFERLVLEINQAGLSCQGFDLKIVAKYGNKDVHRLLQDPGIIRNKIKINAAVENARRILILQEEYGSFKSWLDANHPLALDGWTRIFKTNLVFTGNEIVREFLVSTGYLSGAHDEDCPIYKKVTILKPAWL
jgi:DNA-3-methyladenine glycosylase I